MLVELHVRDLGVIADLEIELGPGMTALTGETGAGKTLVVEALELLVGGRADSSIVRRGAELALIEGRFVDDEGEEHVLVREIRSAGGRSRAWVDGRMSPVSGLAEAGVALLDLHGQHSHQSLLRAEAQRAALDRFAGTDLSEVRRIEAEISRLGHEITALGGEPRQLAHEMDLLRYQIDEITAAKIESPDEVAQLEAEEEVLASAGALSDAANDARELLAAGAGGAGDGHAISPRFTEGGRAGAGGGLDAVGAAESLISAHRPLADLGDRLASLRAELDDIVTELRRRAEGFEEDPQRLAEVQERRRLLGDLGRKYGDTLADVIAFADDARQRLEALAFSEERREALAERRRQALDELAVADEVVAGERSRGAEKLSRELEQRLHGLEMEAAQIGVTVNGRRGDEIELLLGANLGEPLLPLAKVASGGELARAMLAMRLVLTHAPPTLVFDEVDAGIGGSAALAVGRALSEVARRHQVLVVTHLAQVAAFADCQLAVAKEVTDGRTVARASIVTGEDRVAELSRMLSGHPQSESGRAHAAELLEMRG